MIDNTIAVVEQFVDFVDNTIVAVEQFVDLVDNTIAAVEQFVDLVDNTITVVEQFVEWAAVLDTHTSFTYLGEWVMRGQWHWCAVIGYSLGGGMAQIRAAELAVRANSKPVLLATLGSPSAGTADFASILKGRVLPTPVGLRTWNEGDTIPWIGLMGYG